MPNALKAALLALAAFAAAPAFADPEIQPEAPAHHDRDWRGGGDRDWRGQGEWRGDRGRRGGGFGVENLLRRADRLDAELHFLAARSAIDRKEGRWIQFALRDIVRDLQQAGAIDRHAFGQFDYRLSYIEDKLRNARYSYSDYRRDPRYDDRRHDDYRRGW